MAQRSRTLIEYLTEANPNLDSTNSLKGKNTESKKKIYKDFDDIEEWNEFKYDTLQVIFGSTLEDDVSQHDLPDIGRLLPLSLTPDHLYSISDEDSLNSVLAIWIQPIVCTALTVAQLEYQVKDRISMARGGQAYIRNLEGKLKPDWAGIQEKASCVVSVKGKEQARCFNILPGDTKLSTKWKSEKFIHNEKKPNLRMPIRQLMTYCEYAETRYGYLLSQEELVVFRFSQTLRKTDKSPGGPSSRKKRGPNQAIEVLDKVKRHVEFKAIPWYLSNKDGLTIKLALWWLHMMAAREHSVRWKYQDLKVEYRNTSAITVNSTKKRQREDDITPEDASSTSTMRKRTGGRRTPRSQRQKGSQDKVMSSQSDFSVQV